MLNSSGESRHPCLVPDFRGNAFKFLPFRTVFSVGLTFMAFYYVDIYSISACFLESLNHKWVLYFVTSFLCTYWDNHMVLSFNLLIWSITLIDLWIWKNPCIPGIKPTWSWCMIFCWILFARILVMIFSSMFISDEHYKWYSLVVLLLLFFFPPVASLVLGLGWW